jgi:thiol-disulfide isomerase/thioredoxin
MERKKGKKQDRSDGLPEKKTDARAESGPDTTIRIAVILMVVVILGIVVWFGSPLLNPPAAAPATPGTVTVWYFYGTGCEHCVPVTPFIQSLQQKYPDVDFRVHEIYGNTANRDLLVSMNRELGQTKTGIPVVFVGNVVLLGDEEILKKLEGVILKEKKLTNAS